MTEAADRGLGHRLEPLVHLLARHRRAAVLELLGHVVQRSVADPAGRALLARLLGEEAHRLSEQAEHRIARREDLHRRRARSGAPLAQRVTRQRNVQRGGRDDPARGPARHDRADLLGCAACVVVDQLPGRDVERRLEAARLPNGAGHRPQPRRRVLAAQDARHVREGLDVVDQRRPREVALLRGERRAEARHPAAPLHRLEHRRLLPADVRACAHDELDVQPARGDRLTQARTRGGVLLAQVDERVVGLAEAHRCRDALEQELRAQLHHVAVLDRPRLALVGVDDHDAGRGLGANGRPLAEGREAGAAHPGQAGGLEPRQHLVGRELGRLARVIRLVEPRVRAVRDAADDVVALHPHGREIAVADAGDRNCAVRPCAHAVADGAGAGARDAGRHLQEGVERYDLVHLAPADVHVVGERVRELRRDRADFSPDPAEVVEQPRPVDRQLGKDRCEGERVHRIDYRESFPLHAPGSP